MWYNFFGGKKSFKEFVAAGLGVMAWFTSPIQGNKPLSIPALLGGVFGDLRLL